MAKYIDADAARDALYDADAITFRGLQVFDSQPAADVVEVVHGEWLGERGGFTCSICGCEAPEDGGYWASPYCPYCGAKMDGVKDVRSNLQRNATRQF